MVSMLDCRGKNLWKSQKLDALLNLIDCFFIGPDFVLYMETVISRVFFYFRKLVNSIKWHAPSAMTT